jgi:hypothetical protein
VHVNIIVVLKELFRFNVGVFQEIVVVFQDMVEIAMTILIIALFDLGQ